MSEENLSKKELKALRQRKIQEVFARRKTAIKKIGGILVIAIILIAGAAKIIKASKFNNSPQTASLANIVTYKDWTIGVENPNVEIMVYSNFNCDECLNVFNFLNQAETEFQSKIKIVFRNFYLADSSENAETLARLAEAAGLQNKFWETRKFFYENQAALRRGTSTEFLIATTSAPLSLDAEKILIDMDSQEVKSKIARDLESAIIAKAEKAPAIFINNQKIPTPKTYEELKTSIEKNMPKTIE